MRVQIENHAGDFCEFIMSLHMCRFWASNTVNKNYTSLISKISADIFLLFYNFLYPISIPLARNTEHDEPPSML